MSFFSLFPPTVEHFRQASRPKKRLGQSATGTGLSDECSEMADKRQPRVYPM